MSALIRLAIVLWWVGSVALVGGVVLALDAHFRFGSELPWIWAVLGLVAAVVLRAASYVFGGSFWAPPKAP